LGSELRATVEYVLRRERRKVTAEQMQFALLSIAVEPTALYVTLAARVMAGWKSSDSIDNLRLEPTVRGVINQILDGLERDFGRVLTRAALGLITYARSGVSDSEMQDLLSLDDDVLNSVFQYSTLETKRLPLHVWLRLRSALAGLVVEREWGCVVWYHRQLKETAEGRYDAVERTRIHTLLGQYFSSGVEDATRARRLIASQPLTWTEVYVWSPEARINHRRCVEGGFHLCRAGLLAEAATEMCSMEMVCACAKVGQGFALLDNLFDLHGQLVRDRQGSGAADSPEHESAASREVLTRRVDHYIRWLRRDLTVIVTDPPAFIPATCTTTQPSTSLAKSDLIQYLENHRRLPETQRHGWIPCRSLGGQVDFDLVKMSLEGKPRRITCSYLVRLHLSVVISVSRPLLIDIFYSRHGRTQDLCLLNLYHWEWPVWSLHHIRLRRQHRESVGCVLRQIDQHPRRPRFDCYVRGKQSRWKVYRVWVLR